MLLFIERNNLFIEKAILIIVGLSVIYFRYSVLEFPLERDEGEYAYMGQLLLKGFHPYVEAANMKFPGTYFMYAFFMSIFGQTILGIHIGLLITNFFTAIMIFFICRKLEIAFKLSLLSSVLFLILSMDSRTLGFAGHGTNYMFFFAICSLYFSLLHFKKNKSYWVFLSGVFAGLSFIMKQHGVFFIFQGTAIIFLSKEKINFKPYLLYFFGILIPIFIVFFYIYLFSSIDNFWFWTYTYAKEYVTLVDHRQALYNLKISIINVAYFYWPVWVFSLVGFALIVFRKNVQYKIIIFSFFIASLLTAFPGFYFRPHYFLPFLAAISIMISFVLSYFNFNFRWILAVLLLLYFKTLWADNQYYFGNDLDVKSRRIYGGASPFPESIVIAEYIKTHTNSDDKILIFANEPQVYFYTNRMSATKFIYTFNLMETHSLSLQMQKEMIDEIEKNEPKYIMYPTKDHWNVVEDSQLLVFDWLDKYFKNYQLDGIIEYMNEYNSKYIFGKDAIGYKPQTNSYILLYKKTD